MRSKMIALMTSIVVLTRYTQGSLISETQVPDELTALNYIRNFSNWFQDLMFDKYVNFETSGCLENWRIYAAAREAAKCNNTMTCSSDRDDACCVDSRPRELYKTDDCRSFRPNGTEGNQLDKCCGICNSTSDPRYALSCVKETFVGASVCGEDENGTEIPSAPLTSDWDCSTGGRHELDGRDDSENKTVHSCTFLEELLAKSAGNMTNLSLELFENETTAAWFNNFGAATKLFMMRSVVTAGASLLLREPASCMMFVQPTNMGDFEATLGNGSDVKIVEPNNGLSQKPLAFHGGMKASIIGGSNNGTILFNTTGAVRAVGILNRGNTTFLRSQDILLVDVINEASADINLTGIGVRMQAVTNFGSVFVDESAVFLKGVKQHAGKWISFTDSNATMEHVENSGDFDVVGGSTNMIGVVNMAGSKIKFESTKAGFENVSNGGNVTFVGGTARLVNVISHAESSISFYGVNGSFKNVSNAGVVKINGGSYSASGIVNSGTVLIATGTGSIHLHLSCNTGNITIAAGVIGSISAPAGTPGITILSSDVIFTALNEPCACCPTTTTITTTTTVTTTSTSSTTATKTLTTSTATLTNTITTATTTRTVTTVTVTSSSILTTMPSGKASQVVMSVSGSVAMKATNPVEFVKSLAAKTGLRRGIAKIFNVEVSMVEVNLTIDSNVRRLGASASASAGSVKVSYKISFSEEAASAVVPETVSSKIDEVSKNTSSEAFQIFSKTMADAVQSEDASLEAIVTSASPPTIARITVLQTQAELSGPQVSSAADLGPSSTLALLTLRYFAASLLEWIVVL
eukprot:TRINITY_DN16186_c0_g1_i1.p1 TRINITY_DN16186_c0_g1~~TRINITY_DN16186_c0_g1_i1.p1  ORF type:complete len:807 (-),score=147.06 TRINITY_DN16186_c0_g1_i1:557-2977(-)